MKPVSEPRVRYLERLEDLGIVYFWFWLRERELTALGVADSVVGI
jgi:hypothetical protein